MCFTDKIAASAYFSKNTVSSTIQNRPAYARLFYDCGIAVCSISSSRLCWSLLPAGDDETSEEGTYDEADAAADGERAGGEE